MRTFIDHARTFGSRAAENGGELHRLADGQSPLALFITCSDSRVIPSLFTGARPGELFELRTAGNIVPPYRLDRPTSEAATIEFAIEILGVADVVVCGHSHCGAVGALVRGDDLSAAPAVRTWLAEAAGTSPRLPGNAASERAASPPPAAATWRRRSRDMCSINWSGCAPIPAWPSGPPTAGSACTPGTTKCTPDRCWRTGRTPTPSLPCR
ncbi:carbonic anhydrase [Actinomadura luteofluorescens]